MCTAITYKSSSHYFGRNLDIEVSYSEKIVITPREYKFNFRKSSIEKNHYAMVGIATVVDEFPLYFDAVNEMGLGIAGLSFPERAVYYPYRDGYDNIAPFELIPWILSQCKSIGEVRKILKRINIVNIGFSESLKLTPLHWIVADREKSIVIETTEEGMRIYENPTGVLTNSPEFNIQLFNLNNYLSLRADNPENSFSKTLDLSAYSRGMGAIGLPGDLSSMSRFVRSVFTKFNSPKYENDEESINQFFHILNSVFQVKGCNDIGDGCYEITEYSSCCDMDRGIYYYKTYNNSEINGVDMFLENLNGKELIEYPLLRKRKFNIQNSK